MGSTVDLLHRICDAPTYATGVTASWHEQPRKMGSLSYNAVRQAYEIDITDAQLRDAPFYVGDLEFDWGDRSREASMQKVYRTAHYWE